MPAWTIRPETHLTYRQPDDVTNAVYLAGFAVRERERYRILLTGRVPARAAKRLKLPR